MPTTKSETAAELPVTTEAPRFLPMTTLPIRLTAAELSSRDPVFGIVANISQTGACVIINRGLPKNIKLDVTMSTTGGRDLVRLPVEIVWCAERLEPVKEIVGYLTGLKFAPASKETIATLLSSGMFQLVS